MIFDNNNKGQNFNQDSQVELTNIKFTKPVLFCQFDFLFVAERQPIKKERVKLLISISEIDPLLDTFSNRGFAILRLVSLYPPNNPASM